MTSRNREQWKVQARAGDTRRRRGRRWLLGGVGVPLLLAVCFWFAPTLIAHTSLRQKVVSAALSDFQGQVTVGGVSLGWLSPLAAYDVAAVDSRGGPLAEVKSLTSEKTLLALLSDRHRPGAFRLEQPQLQVELRDNGSNWEEALAAYLSGPSQGGGVRAVKLDIVGGTLQVRDPAGNPQWQVSELNASAEYAVDTDWPVLVRASGQVEASPQRRGSVAAELTWRETPEAAAGMGDGQVTVRLENAPLDVLASAARRWIGDVTVRGDATGEGVYQWTDNGGRQNIRIDRLTCRDAAVKAPRWLGPDELRSAVLESHGRIENAGPEWHVQGLALKTDFAELRAQGAIHADRVASIGSWNALLDELLEEGTQLTGQVDLARLAAQLPATLRLRAGTAIKSGQADVSLASQGGNSPGLVARLEVTNLAAGDKLVADKPIIIGAKLHRTNTGPVIDELVCQSDFLNVTAQGTLVQGSAVVRGDLTRLADQLGQVVDLKGLRLAGRLDGDLSWQRRGDQAVAADGKVTLAGFELAAQDGLPWREQQLVVTLAAAGQTRQDQLSRLESATVTVESGDDRLDAELQQPVDQPQGDAVWPLRLRAVGDLATWLPRLKPFFTLDSWQLSGGLDLTATAKVAPARIEAEAVKCELTKLHAAGNRLTIDEPLVRVETQAAWDRAKRLITASSATVTSSTVAFRADQVALHFPPEGTKVSGAVSYRADVGRLARWTADPRRPPANQWSGALSGQAEATHEGTVTRLEWTAEVKDLVYAGRASAAGAAATPVSLPAGASEVWREPLLKLTGGQRYDHQRDVLEIDRVTVASTTVALAASGSIAELSGRCVADVQGNVEYDWKRVTEQLRTAFGPQLEVAGTERGQFRLRGPLVAPAAAEAPATAALVAPELTGSAEGGWQSARLLGLTIGQGRLQSTLERGVVQLQPLEIPVAEGRIKLAAQVDLNKSPATLVMAKGPVAENVSLSPELCRGWLKYVAPLLADATAAEGRFSLTLDSLSVPLSDTDKSDIHGELAIHAAQVGPGPLAQEFLSIAGQVRALVDGKTGLGSAGQTWLTVPEQNLHFDVQEGRVHHRDFTVHAGDVVIRTTGSVGLNQSLAVTAEVPIRDEWVAQRSLLASLKGTTLRIPIGGLISKPQLDRRALANFNQQTIRNAAGRVLQDEALRGLDRLLQPRP